MGRGYEQRPSGSVNGSKGMATIEVKRTGDEGIDAGMVDLYASQGYQFKEKTASGTVVMEMPVEKAKALNDAAIAEHYRRAKSAERANSSPDVNIVEDTSKNLTAGELLGVLDDDPMEL